MKKQPEAAWVGPKAEWGRASGNHQGGANSVRKDDGVSDLVLSSSGSGGEGSDKEQWPLLVILSGRKLLPISHPDDGQFSFFSYVSDNFHSAASTLVSEGASLSKL